MIASSLFFVLIFSDGLNELNKYQIIGDWIEDKNGNRVAEMIKYDLYDNNKRLKLYSRLGFSLTNIPMDNNRFYNECIEIFLEIEKELPLARQKMRDSRQNTREINGLKFSFPLKPVINSDGFTYFWHPNAYTCDKDGTYKEGAMWLIGMYEPNTDLIFVTLHPNYHHFVSIHEYIHACGYGHVCNSDLEQEKRNFKYAERAN